MIKIKNKKLIYSIFYINNISFLKNEEIPNQVPTNEEEKQIQENNNQEIKSNNKFKDKKNIWRKIIIGFDGFILLLILFFYYEKINLKIKFFFIDLDFIYFFKKFKFNLKLNELILKSNKNNELYNKIKNDIEETDKTEINNLKINELNLKLKESDELYTKIKNDKEEICYEIEKIEINKNLKKIILIYTNFFQRNVNKINFYIQINKKNIFIKSNKTYLKYIKNLFYLKKTINIMSLSDSDDIYGFLEDYPINFLHMKIFTKSLMKKNEKINIIINIPFNFLTKNTNIMNKLNTLEHKSLDNFIKFFYSPNYNELNDNELNDDKIKLLEKIINECC